jgi:hypothetical protein
MSRCLSLSCLVILTILAAVSSGCVPQEALPADEEPPVVRSAECRRVAGRIRINGIIDDVAWAKAQVLEDFAVFWDKRKPKSATKARLLWDNLYLYFCAEMEDVDLYADVKDRNGMTWTNDVFELFFKPSADSLAYYEIQVNAADTPLELFLPSRGAGGWQRFAPLTDFGMEHVVQLRGTLNDMKDRDRGWTVEGRIPWKAFAPSGGRPQPGAKWRFALCRYDYAVTLESPELSSTAPLTKPDFHRYEDYGALTFVQEGD